MCKICKSKDMQDQKHREKRVYYICIYFMG